MIYYVFLHALLFVWTVFNSLSMPRLSSFTARTPSVAILVPMRNEEKNVDGLLASLQKLTYPNLKFYLLDDGSEDETWNGLTSAADSDPRIHLLKGEPLPSGWVGKVHACHQLSRQAEEEYLLFLDADVRIEPDLVQKALGCFHPETGLVTGFPHVPLKSILGHLIVPMQHFLVFFHLPVSLANGTQWLRATAAHGAFMMFRTSAYNAIQGHESVKNSLVEDIHIARNVKKAGWRVRLVNIAESVSCYMYGTSREVWEGFSKNFFPGLGKSLPAAAVFIILYTILFLLPIPAAVYGIVTKDLLYLLPLLFSVLIKLTVDLTVRQKWWLALFFPLSVAAAFAVLFYSIFLSLSKQGFTWKGRNYQ